ncbi:MAG: chemotaxis protein CheD [Spirochaetes bacterium]|nr:chemotaxis protein CheD [Spirochaetota bacterium]
MKQHLVLREYYLRPGYMYITQEANSIYTVLGNCVMVCLWDRITHLAGTCNYKFPSATEKEKATAQYGNAALNSLIKIMAENGCKTVNIEAMLFGGADKDYQKGIGHQNVEIAKKILKKNKIRVVSEDTGGIKGRKVIYHTVTNQAVIYKVNNLRDCDWHPYI